MLQKQEELLQKITNALKFAQSYQDLGLKPAQWQNVNHVFLLAISHIDFQSIHHTVCHNSLEIFADPLLEQVFLIIAENTLIHGERATRVILQNRDVDGAMMITYEDDGIGIPESIKDSIFSSDFQERRGVGLFLAREILEITGITLREVGIYGGGARFEITVPPGGWRFADW